MDYQDEQLGAYRQGLIETLLGQVRRRRREKPSSLQVFANQESIGTADCERCDVSFKAVHQGKAIRMLEVRSETGLVLGSLFPREAGTTQATFAGGRYTLVVTVNNRPDGGSVQVVYQRAVGLTSRLWDFARKLAAKPLLHPGGIAPSRQESYEGPSRGLGALVGSRSLALAQILMVLVVPFLTVELLRDRLGSQQDDTAHSWQDAITKQQHMLMQLAEAQDRAVRTIETQQHGLAQVSEALASLTRSQEQFLVQLAAVQQGMSRRSKDVEERLTLALQGVEAERSHLQRQIRELAEAKQILTAAAAKPQSNERDAGSKPTQPAGTASPPQPKNPDAGKGANVSLAPSGSQPQVAEAKRDPQGSPFTFWVSFHDGTPEESIDHLIHEINGRRGTVDDGWYNVEVVLPQPETPDRFLKSLQNTKIVKALTISRKPHGE